MQQLQLFSQTFWQSLASLKYYRLLLSTRFSFSLKYYLFFSLILGTTISVLISLVIYQPINTFSQRLKQRLPFAYPQDLEISIQNGQLSTNASEPLRFPIPWELFTQVPPAVSDQKQLYLLVIDTQANLENFTDYQTLILATEKHLLISDRSQGFQVVPLENFDNIDISKAYVDNIIKRFLPLVDAMPYLVIIVLLIIFILLLPISKLVGLLILSLILMFMAKLLKINLTYKKIYQIGLHSQTLPTMIQFGLAAWGLFPPIPFFYSVLFLLYNLVILAELRRNQV